MKTTGWVAAAGWLVAACLWAPMVAAQEPAGNDDEGRQQGEGGSWRSKFRLYVEASTGSAEAQRFNTSLATSEVQFSQNHLDLVEQDHARLAVGWTLPEDRGAFRLAFEGFREAAYEFTASGRRLNVVDPTVPNQALGSRTLAEVPVQWWSVRIANGRMVSAAQQPNWVETQDDANLDGVPNVSEIWFTGLPFGTSRDVTDTLDNQLQTLDAVYERGFGGRRYRGRWGAGARYMRYKGNLPAAAWLRISFQADSATQHGGYQGFTDGATLRLLSFSQDSTGLGPTGFAEFHINFLRERIRLFWQVRASFLVLETETDSGPFTVLVQDGDASVVLPLGARLQESRNKDTWNSGAEAGVQVRLAQGLMLNLGYFLNVYHDVMLVATDLSIPEAPQQLAQGVAALYSTRDLKLNGWRGGFSFQF